MQLRSILATTLLVTAVAPIAWAQPSDKSDAGKEDAKALLASGLKLFGQKDYLGALSVFQSAYDKFSSPKILLNIGTTLIKLDRKAEAANTYQRYLDAKDVDITKQADAQKILAGLDKELGVVTIAAEPGGAEIQVNGAAKWVPADTIKKVRVNPGDVTVLARASHYKLRAETFKITAGETRGLELKLEEEPAVVETAPTSTTTTFNDNGISKSAESTERSRIAALVAWHVDPVNKGSAVLVGFSADVISQLSVQATGLIGPHSGAYAGVTFAFLPGKVRPMISAGMPIIFADGARVSARGAAGVELAVNKHLALIAEVGVERFLNAADNIEHKTVFIPSIGATARL
ncbi:MAG TPA: hypothetical protein VGM90_12390 [Kofleriaceae bacterium]|jgi:hypothetical protein